MRYHLVELCCGSAALSLHLCGARRALLPYQGSKWRFRHALVSAMAERGLSGAPAQVQLTDPGPWGAVLPTLLDAPARTEVIAHLVAMDALDAREVFDSLHGHRVSTEATRHAAEFLFLQRLSYSGKAVGIRDGRWSSPGFNTSSAYGLAATSRFGKVNPMIPSLIRVLRGLDTQLVPVEVAGGQRGAAEPAHPLQAPTLVYIDPPYAGSTLYPNGDLPRARVVALALAWQRAGATVMVSEGEALPALLQEGWSARQLYIGRQDASPFRGKQPEWLTVSPERG